ncbi:MAG: hypothetical protein JXK93_11410 [Sphaerochaetaceae bacterium]|nr:hypothetical protein [Sphaerochaetaceae bacterium]
MNKEVRMYIESFERETRERLLLVREHLLSRMETGTWEEGTAYGIPYVSCRGKRLLYYSATKKWISLHPFPDTLEAFRERLESYSLSKGTIRFPHTQEIDYVLLGEIVSYRLQRLDP